MDTTDLSSLDPWGGLLARSQPPRQRLDVIVSNPAAASLVPRMPVEDFYYLVKDLGMEDAGELLGWASADQIRGCVDFDAWEGDQVVAARLVAWLGVLASELLPARFARAMQALDIELLALVFTRYCHVFDRSVGEEPDPDSNLHRYATPDTFYFLEIDADAETTRVLEQVMERLYASDADLARRLILETKWGLASELEESGYRLRSGRMADLGFIEYYEALEVYRYVDARHAAGQETSWRAAGRPDDATVLPALFASPFGSDSFLTRALHRLDDVGLVEQLGATLLVLLNRVLVADRIDPADIDNVHATVGRAHDTLSLGLEILADGDPEKAVDLLRQRPLLQIFRVGFSATLDLSRKAMRWRDGGNDDPGLDALIMRRPHYPRALDEPPRGGERPFRTRADVRRVETFLAAVGSPPQP